MGVTYTLFTDLCKPEEGRDRGPADPDAARVRHGRDRALHRSVRDARRADALPIDGDSLSVHLYQGTTEQFIADATQARLANQLADRFFDEFRYRPAPSEVTSWRNSLSAMATVLHLPDLRDQVENT